MRPLFYFFIISIITLCSCNSKDNKISIVGKWYQLSFREGYAEFEIDPQYVVVFSERIGYSKIEYKIENDSLKYPKINYLSKIIPQGDSIINFIGYKMTSTLIRWNESITPFESVPGAIKNKNDSLKYKLYLENFDKRAKQAYIKAGVIMD